MTWLRSEEEVDKMIEDMATRTKGRYITQGVSFNKTCPRQMELLKKALMSSVSFSGLGKELLAVRFSGEEIQKHSIATDNQIKKKDIGNFL
jgi:translation initiation factor 2 beta subunit (eIF-2beta)/eIF-5